MQITNEFEVDQPIGAVWEFFGDIPAVAECLPGADLTDELGEDHYGGTVAIGLGPVKLDFDGEVKILERSEADKTISVDASGADKKGRGQAAMLLDAGLRSVGAGTRVHVAMDLNISGAAAQYGRGLVSDVTSVLLDDFATNVQNRLIAVSQGRDPSQVQKVQTASGFAIALRAARVALTRVFRRFFRPYNPEFVQGG
ncbi:MAG: SRPBCC family protein [Acidimicrobiaceae bacterium]|nr:SRPBCC family protein [Acidimicrobiaceae bacterium]